jgi:CBS domain-containing protein
MKEKVKVIPVKTIMTTDLVTVHPHAPIYEALNLLKDHQVSGLPVVDEENHLVGILTEKDVLTLLISPEPRSVTVSDYMSRKVVCFKEDDSAISVCEFFLKNAIRRVPIVRDGKFVGIVSRRDIISLILEVESKISDFRFS